MEFNTVIYLLVLSSTSVLGRISIRNEALPDISNYVTNEVDKYKTNVDKIHIDLPTFRPNNDDATVATTKKIASNELTTPRPNNNIAPDIVPSTEKVESNQSNTSRPNKDNAFNAVPTTEKLDSNQPTTVRTDIDDTTNKAPTSENIESKTVPNATSTANVPNEPAVINNDVLNIILNSDENDVLPVEDSGVVLKLTPYIKEKRLKDARSDSKVNHEIFLGVESYSGFLTVNETYDSNLFFWYFPVEKKPVNETPWIIWLQGGPGASSMTGLFDEIGPFTITPDYKLTRNPYSWLVNHSLLFIDNPVGAGFSYTMSEEGYVTDMDTYGAHLYTAVKQFLQIFPELRAAPLYIAGESYAGKYVPALAINIHRHKHDEQINLQGLITGNAYVDPAMVMHMERTFRNFGLMMPEQIEKIQPLIDAFRKDVADNNSAGAKEKWNQVIGNLITFSYLKHGYNFLQDDGTFGRYTYVLDQPKIKKAIHIGDAVVSYVNMTVNQKLYGEFLTSAQWIYEELLEHYRVLTYCGQLDLMLSCAAVSDNYRSWRWAGAAQFRRAPRQPYWYHYRLAGYHKTGGGLTEVMIRGAGHMAPQDAPAPTQRLVARWTHGQSLNYIFPPAHRRIQITNSTVVNSTLPVVYL